MTQVTRTMEWGWNHNPQITMDEAEWNMMVYVNKNRKGFLPVYHTNPACRKIAEATEIVPMTRLEALTQKQVPNGSYPTQTICQHCAKSYRGYDGY